MQYANEKEELKKTVDESERKRVSKDVEISELGDMLDDIRRSNDSLSSQKMKLLSLIKIELSAGSFVSVIFFFLVRQESF